MQIEMSPSSKVSKSYQYMIGLFFPIFLFVIDRLLGAIGLHDEHDNFAIEWQSIDRCAQCLYTIVYYDNLLL
jgi:hypothetical protein